jgi:DNA-binding Lrp family transcriptional regulator
MAKSSKEQIDADEKKVIRELQKSSKESIDKIAKKCDFSQQKVWRIIKRLEKNKTIWGYNVVVDNEKLDLINYLILIKRTNKPIEKTADKIISRELEEKADEIGIVIHSSHYLHGEFDWQICFTSENIGTAKKFCEFLNSTYRPSIKELKLLEILFPVKSCGIQNPNLEELKDFL